MIFIRYNNHKYKDLILLTISKIIIIILRNLWLISQILIILIMAFLESKIIIIVIILYDYFKDYL